MTTITYFSTARLAYEMKLHQGYVQELIKTGAIEKPEIQLKGIGVRPAQSGYSLEAIKRIAARWKSMH